jgi:hypothetical protein
MRTSQFTLAEKKAAMQLTGWTTVLKTKTAT